MASEPVLKNRRIEIQELKSNLLRRIGEEKTRKYFNLLSRFLSQKLSRPKFTESVVRTIGKENIPLHNQFLRGILRNAHNGSGPAANAQPVSGITGKTPSGHIGDALGKSVSPPKPPPTLEENVQNPNEQTEPVNAVAKFRALLALRYPRPTSSLAMNTPNPKPASVVAEKKTPEVQNPNTRLKEKNKGIVEVITIDDDDGEQVEPVNAVAKLRALLGLPEPQPASRIAVKTPNPKPASVIAEKTPEVQNPNPGLKEKNKDIVEVITIEDDDGERVKPVNAVAKLRALLGHPEPQPVSSIAVKTPNPKPASGIAEKTPETRIPYPPRKRPRSLLDTESCRNAGELPDGESLFKRLAKRLREESNMDLTPEAANLINNSLHGFLTRMVIKPAADLVRAKNRAYFAGSSSNPNLAGSSSNPNLAGASANPPNPNRANPDNLIAMADLRTAMEINPNLLGPIFLQSFRRFN